MLRGCLFALALTFGTALNAQGEPPAVPGSDATGMIAQSYASQAPANSDFAKARAALVAGRYDEAQRRFQPLADGSMSTRVQLMAGYAELGAGNTRRAIDRFGRALSLDHTNVFARHGLGLARISAGQRGLATDQLTELEAARERCGSGCGRTADLDRAISSLRRAIG